MNSLEQSILHAAAAALPGSGSAVWSPDNRVTVPPHCFAKVKVQQVLKSHWLQLWSGPDVHNPFEDGGNAKQLRFASANNANAIVSIWFY